MAYTQFPHQQYYRIMNTNEEGRCGYFNLQDGTELKHMMFDGYYHNIQATPFNIRAKIYGNDTLIDPIFTSEWAEISADTLGSVVGHNRVFSFYLDFGGVPLNPNIDYFMTLETADYTRNGDVSYFGYNLDWYSPVNNQLSGTEAGARIRILGKR